MIYEHGHEEKINFTCDQSENHFKNSTQLTDHKNEEHGEAPYSNEVTVANNKIHIGNSSSTNGLTVHTSSLGVKTVSESGQEPPLKTYTSSECIKDPIQPTKAQYSQGI